MIALIKRDCKCLLGNPSSTRKLSLSLSFSSNHSLFMKFYLAHSTETRSDLGRVLKMMTN